MPILSLGDDLKQRGLVYQSNDWAGSMARLLEGPCCAYVGFDCTAPSLHVGSLMPIMMLRRWQKAGHRPIVLFGSATTLVGDPTGKEKSRPMLTPEDIAENKKSLSDVFRQFLDIDDPLTGAIFVDNATWWKDISYLDLLRTVGPHMTINHMVHFETVARRLETQQPLSFLEFNYMILQGYDFVHLAQNHKCFYQFGGSDQWGNMIVGADLIHKMHQQQAYVITAPLLTTAAGKKMGKTEQGAVWLNKEWLSDFDYWQFWRNCDDKDCEKLMLAMTDLEPAFIKSYFENLEPGQINEAKILLANEQTKMCRGPAAQKQCYERAQAVFTGDIQERKAVLQSYSIDHTEDCLLLDFLIQHQLIASKSAGKKLIEQNAIKIDDLCITNVFHVLQASYYQEHTSILSVGKKKHYLIVGPSVK